METDKKMLIAKIEHEIRRINCPGLTFHPEQERVSLETRVDKGATLISWPYPHKDLQALEILLVSIPANSSVEQVEMLTKAYSMGWTSGRGNLLIQQMERARPELRNMKHSVSQSEQELN